uniref:Ribosomal protein S11 n=1 Tax=Erodium texanum TaxID=28960 RepID=B7T313_EROTE|nr:ribosomal protein S11 [Erodium texanum]ACH47330.1 ribosomal protein S11 [Erodium texanum]ADJ66277.1 ribosomal protein S11 [Erodium texanum]
MAKPIGRYSSSNLRKKRRIRLRKNIRKIRKGIIHVQASFNNTIVTVTDVEGRVVTWASAGVCGFKGRRKGTPFAAQTTTEDAIGPVVAQGMHRASVLIKGIGLGRDAALRTICRSGVRLYFIRDITPMPHNGCRPPKKRRT